MAARAGATSVTRKPRLGGGRGNVVRVTVSYTDGHGTAGSLTSAQSAVIANVK